MTQSGEDSVFSRLCHVALITFLKVLQLSEGCIWNIWNSLDTVLRLLKNTQNNSMAIRNINCGRESVIGTFEQIIQNSVENSVFSRLCHISWNSLESVLRLSKDFRGKIPCFPD